MKVFSMSQRIYYKDLEPEAESIIKKDIELYNCIFIRHSKSVLIVPIRMLPIQIRIKE